VDEVAKGCLGNGCSDSKEVYGLQVGELHLVMDTNVSKLIYSFYPFSLVIFSFKRLIWEHCPGAVTSGGNVTHKNFTEKRRLAHDLTPFLLDMPPRATTLAW
jgi:hypothetical protein